jgi:uncharacterized hydrophobic protein (TIGR00271 family)
MIKKLLQYLNFHSEVEDYEEIHSSIEKGILFRGTNLWILVAAIIIASVGLNTNSTAVIIGAMLISPLMGPITGMGYSIAINDKTLFKRAIKNYNFAVLASLAASTLYFIISPVSNDQSELLARTSPTMYDVLIALFGGFAGIIAISSKQKGNVIPGVAIATALMPPLCTAGYGLATGQLRFFFGAIYLFTINTVCIALASTVVSQALKFPIRSNIPEARKKRINHIISLVLTITVLPSIYLGYKLVGNQKFSVNAQRYVESISIYKGNYLLKHNIEPDKRHIELIYGGTSLTDEDKAYIKQQAIVFKVDTNSVSIKQGISFDVFQEEVANSQTQENLMKQEIARLNLLVASSREKLDSINNCTLIGKQLLSEIAPIYPQITSCMYSQGYTLSQAEGDNSQRTDLVVFSSNHTLKAGDKAKIKDWLGKRLNSPNVVMLFRE